MNSYPHTPGYQPRDTSKAAAKAVEPRAGSLQRFVLQFIRACGDAGATDDEIQTIVGPTLKTTNPLRPRRCELLAKGLVKDSGKRRKTSSGRPAAVWVAT